MFVYIIWSLIDHLQPAFVFTQNYFEEEWVIKASNYVHLSMYDSEKQQHAARNTLWKKNRYNNEGQKGSDSIEEKKGWRLAKKAVIQQLLDLIHHFKMASHSENSLANEQLVLRSFGRNSSFRWLWWFLRLSKCLLELLIQPSIGLVDKKQPAILLHKQIVLIGSRTFSGSILTDWVTLVGKHAVVWNSVQSFCFQLQNGKFGPI